MEIYLSTSKKKHYKQNKKALKQWVSVTYPEISKKAVTENAEIYWTDEVGIQNTTNYVKGYAPIGKTPTIPVATKHIRVNMISAITNKGKLKFHFYSEKMNQDNFKKFLINLMNSTDKKIYVISDNLSAHHGLRLKNWAKTNKDKINLFYLPSYAPELNPVEYLNNNLKYEIAKTGYSKDRKEIKNKALHIMTNLQSKKNYIVSLFKNKQVRYAKK